MNDTAIRMHMFVQREASGHIVLVTSDRHGINAEPGDTITEQDVWIEVES